MMKLIKSIIAMTVAIAATAVLAGDSAPFWLDTVTTSTSPVGCSLAILWDSSWIGGNANATVVIADNGMEIKRTTGTGEFTHTFSGDNRHDLTYTTYISGVEQPEVYAVTAYTKYEVNFDANGGSADESIRYVTPGNAVGTLPTSTRTGYTFKGWWTDANGGTQITALTTVSGHMTCYAHWKVNTYTVTFNANGGTGGTTSVTRDYGQTIGTLPMPARAGCAFAGWWTSASGGTQISSSTKVTSNVTYYVHWMATVMLNANGGTVDTATVVRECGQAVGTLPTPTHTDYNTFAGWWTAASGGTQISASTIVSGDVTYYARWKNMYTATFNANGGTGGITKTQEYGTSLTAPTVTRTGYTFTGWSPSVPSTMLAGNTTYTAQWKINQYTVTFAANGGTGGWSRKQNYGSAIVAPTVTREWCTFTGWSPAVAATVPANNVTYTAQWARWGDTISASKMGGKTMKQLYPSDYATMTTVILEECVRELPAGFFDGCDNVEFVTWPSTLQEFGIDDLPSKIRATVEGKYDADGFLIYNNWILDYRNRNASAVTIPNGVVGIGRVVFAAMYDLETVTMPESLRCIAKGAFEDCSWLLNLQFMSGLRYVGPVAFRGCSSLLGASFADGVEILGTNVFENCWQMQSVRLPYTVTNIGVKAFTGCSAIRGVTVPTHLKTMQNLFPASYAQIETAEVAGGETTVMDDMFAGCVALRGGATQTDMSMIPNTVTNIGARAFQGCTSLTAFVVPDSVVKLGVSVFQGCTSLWNVTLSRSLTEIPDYAFYGCSMLETMVVPESVAYLGNRFFSGRTDPVPGIVIENELYYLCLNAPNYHSGAYAALAGNMTTYVLQDSRSWDGRQGSRVLPQSWNGYPITYWTPNRFDVTFDANGGQFDSMGGSTWSEQQITDTPYALPSTEPVRPGWAFEGWWTEQTGGAEVRYTTLVTATRAHTIYAHWRSLGNKMTVTFNSNGGTVVTPGTQDYVPGQTFGQFPVPTRRGYLFIGWYRMPSMPGETVTEETVVKANVTWYAHWVKDSLGEYASVQNIFLPVPYSGDGATWTVQFDPGQGQLESAYRVMRVERGKKFGTLPVPTRVGYAFAGWRTVPEQDGRVTEGEEVPAADMELFAHWMPIIYYVRFNPNGGTDSAAHQMFAFDEQQNLHTHMFERTGFAFTGWATTPSGQVRYPENKSVVNLEEVHFKVVDLYAVWSGVGYSVRFDSNGGTGIMDNQTIAVGETQNLWPCAFARAGYAFAGWALSPTDAEAKKVKYRDGAAIRNLATASGAVVPLYAVWVAKSNTVRIAFDANGGSVAPDYWDCVVNTAVEAFPLPTRPGFTFAGWWTARTGGTRVSSIAQVTSSQTFYAHWTGNGDVDPGDGSYTVTFNANGGSVSQTSRTVAKNAMVGDLPTPVRTGYTFAGWWTAANGGVQVNASTKVTSSVTFYAHWTGNQYTVTFNANGGTGGKSMKQNYGSVIVAPTVTRSGYTFAGWSPAVAATVPANNVTYDALWTKNQAPTPTPTPTPGPTPTPTPEETPVLFEEVEGEAPATAASEYNGYLYDERGAMRGSIQVKVGKPNAKTGLASVKATVVVGAAKKSLKGADKGKVVLSADGPTELELVGGEACEIVLGAEGLSGTYGSYEIDGARNFFTSKNKGEQNAANAVLGKWLGGVSILADVGNFTVTISAKGKAKVSGTLANGKKATGSAVFLVGEEWACVPVVLPKANISFALWLPLDGGEVVVNGLGDDVVAGRGGALKAGAAFRIDEDEFAAVTGIAALPYLPDGVSVEPKGTKWAVAGGAKAGKVAYRRGTQEIDEAKLGDNPSGLKLTYKAKDGSFKGSFKAYAEVKGKLKATTVSVSGIVLNGVGYGTATVKGKGSVPVTIE